MVGTEAVAGLEVLDHEVGELLDVAGGAEDRLRGHRGALHLEHALVEDEVLAPEGLEVGLDGAAGRAVVVETGDTTVNLEGGDVEQAGLERVAHLGAEVLLRLGLLVAGRHRLLHLGVEVDLQLLELGDGGVVGLLVRLLSL